MNLEATCRTFGTECIGNYKYPIQFFSSFKKIKPVTVFFSHIVLLLTLTLASQGDYLHKEQVEGCIWFITLHVSCSAVYVIGPVCLCGCGCLWVCYHVNSKLRVSILTKLGL